MIPRPSPRAAMRHSLLWASRRRSVQRTVVRAPVTGGLVRRFVAGETVDDAARVTRTLIDAGFTVSLDHLGEDTRDAARAAAAVDTYRTLVHRLAEEGLAAGAEASIKLSALGQALDEAMALDHARAVCEASASAGTTVTVDMEDHTTTDSTLRIIDALRADFPSTGAVIQASLHRSEEDCHALAVRGSRVRLCKGAYQEPAAIAWQGREEVRDAYMRCLRILVDGRAYPMVATHDPVLVEAAEGLIGRSRLRRGDYEHQMLFGIRPDEQRRLVRGGARLRVYVPFGTEWYGYLMRRMAERPANLTLVLRAMVSRG